ncbi:MAG: hypothetical protein J5800_03780 [Spirochaetales bacterium]|nr:hypothetical protein [Spirochaetales bacterium]
MISDEKLFMIAVAYYANGRHQQDIADELGVSHVQIDKYLKMARQKGIVEITINPPYVDADEQKRQQMVFRSMFGLENLVLVPTAASQEQSMVFLIKGAVKYILSSFSNKSTRIGVGMGRTMFQLSDSRISYADRRTAWRFYPIMNYYDQKRHEWHDYFNYQDMIDGFSKNWGGRPDKEFMERFSEEKAVSRYSKYWNKLDIIIGGVGVPFPRDPNARAAMFGEKTASEIDGKDILGDYLNYHFDSDGNVLQPCSLSNCRIEWDEIQNVPERIAIAGGPSKVPGILGLLRAKGVNTLITDIATAKGVLEYNNI